MITTPMKDSKRDDDPPRLDAVFGHIKIFSLHEQPQEAKNPSAVPLSAVAGDEYKSGGGDWADWSP